LSCFAGYVSALATETARRQPKDRASSAFIVSSSDLQLRPIRSLLTRSTLPVVDTLLSTGYQSLALACCCKRTSAPQHDRRIAVQLHSLYDCHKSQETVRFFIYKILDSINSPIL
jgi:hypothetical protein